MRPARDMRPAPGPTDRVSLRPALVRLHAGCGGLEARPTALGVAIGAGISVGKSSWADVVHEARIQNCIPVVQVALAERNSVAAR